MSHFTLWHSHQPNSNSPYTAQSDYISPPFSITFGPEESEKSIQVPIIDDSLREHSEFFTVQLTVLYNGSFFSQKMLAMIEILYSDCK